MKPVKKIASLFLLMVLLTTSTGFNIYTIFCQMTGESYRTPVESHCCCHDLDSTDSCCDQEAEFAQLDIESSVSKLQINPEPHFFIAWIQYQVNQVVPVKDLDASKYYFDSPPPIERDIPVLVQSFLI